MEVSAGQLQSYDDAGFLLIPEVFSPEEIAALRARLPAILAEDSPRRIMEKDGTTVRSVYGSHVTDPLFGQLASDWRIVRSVERIVKSRVYVHQSKINWKGSFSGDAWAWHQDYIFWQKEDGVSRPDLTTAAVFLDEVNEFNGPISFIRGSHKKLVIDVEGKQTSHEVYRQCPPWISNLTAEIKYSVPNEMVSVLARGHEMVAPKGLPGSVLFFHPNVVHASASNISPFNRAVVMITYNSIHNIPTKLENVRPDFLCSRDYTAVTPQEFTVA
jgi:ectoine hydroxylase